jgi:hypothetical protein
MNFLEASYEGYGRSDSSEMVIDFGTNVFICKFAKYLLVDARRTRDSNIDIQHVIPGGFSLFK